MRIIPDDWHQLTSAVLEDSQQLQWKSWLREEARNLEQQGILMQREDVIMEWIFLPRKPNKKLKTYIEKISDLIHKDLTVVVKAAKQGNNGIQIHSGQQNQDESHRLYHSSHVYMLESHNCGALPPLLWVPWPSNSLQNCDEVNSDTQGSMSGSVPPSQQGFQASEVPARSQDSLNEPRKQQKNRTVFTLEQKLVLQEHYEKCIYVSQDQCMALAQRFGLKEHIIKVWFKNRRAKEKQKKARQVTGEASCGSPSRPSFLEGCATPATSVSADSLCQRPECSPDQESNLLILGQDPEEVGFRQSPSREQTERQKDRQLPGRSGHQSSGLSGLCQVSAPLPGPDSSQAVQEGPLGVSSSQLGQDSHYHSSSLKGSVLPMASPCEDSCSQRQSGGSSPSPLSPTIVTEPESVLCITQTNEGLLNKALKSTQDFQAPAAGGRIPSQSADCAFYAHPTLAHDVDSIPPLESSTSSEAAPETATKAAERVKQTPSVNSIPETKDYQDSIAIQDQLFMQHLCELDASIVPLSPSDFFENFFLLDFF
ncbi:hypothetical protein STEG23_017697 [Scotinomys teguina]